MKKVLSFIMMMAMLLCTVPVYAAEPDWIQDSVGWRYVDENGNEVVSAWVKESSVENGVETVTYYYIGENGYMVTGWCQVDGEWYYFNSDGSMYTGWLKSGENWYYFNENGKMHRGWIELKEKWYYLDETGVMLTGWQKINNTWRYFNTKGEWIDDNSAIENSIVGIDVSYWQDAIDWDAVKADGIEFAFIRVGHGERKLDTKFKKNISEANRVGIPVGVYFYSTAQTEEQAILDAQFVIDSVSGYTISYPIVIDMEDKSQINLGKDKITDITLAFCEEIRAAGYTPMIYCNENWYKNYLDFSRLQDVEHWIARYANKGASDIERDIWQAGSNTHIKGITGNVDIDFAYVDYTKRITPRTNAIDTYVKRTGIWKQNEKGFWYAHLDGTYTTNAWEKIGEKWYYFDERGYLKTSQWIYDADTWYYVDASGAKQIGWKLINEKWYYFATEDGAMQSGWEFINNRWYYLGAANDGSMKTGWQYISNKWYYFDETGSGAMQSGWKMIKDKWYYFGAANDGSMKIGWQYINGRWYYLSNTMNDGSMKTGWQYINNKWYYMDETGSGAMKTGWQYIGNKWYYMYDSGEMASNTWIGKYYVNKSGVWTKTR